MIKSFHGSSPRQRPYSIRTRIKTACAPCHARTLVCVRDHIPLEQGLRLNEAKLEYRPGFVRDHIPLEQGLRPFQETE